MAIDRYHWLLNDQEEYVDEIYWDNFENLALIEVANTGEFSAKILSQISHGEQAAYMEFYLDSNGKQQLSEPDLVGADSCRICFFMHFVDLSQPLQVGDKMLKLSKFEELPDRLKPFVHYLPVD